MVVSDLQISKMFFPDYQHWGGQHDEMGMGYGNSNAFNPVATCLIQVMVALVSARAEDRRSNMVEGEVAVEQDTRVDVVVVIKSLVVVGGSLLNTNSRNYHRLLLYV